MDNYYNCIYMYTNKNNGKKYIGQAKNFKRRCQGHVWSSNNENDVTYNQLIHKAIRKYGIESFDICVLRYNLETQCLMDLYESYYIEKYNTNAKTGHGYNVADGGKAGNKFAGKTEDEMKDIGNRISAGNMGENNGMYGKPRSDNIKQEQAQRMKGNTYGYGYIRTDEAKKKLSDSRKQWVYQYDLQGNLLGKWKFATHAVKDLKELNLSDKMIAKCCRGEIPTYRGYVWVRK